MPTLADKHAQTQPARPVLHELLPPVGAPDEGAAFLRGTDPSATPLTFAALRGSLQDFDSSAASLLGGRGGAHAVCALSLRNGPGLAACLLHVISSGVAAAAPLNPGATEDEASKRQMLVRRGFVRAQQ